MTPFCTSVGEHYSLSRGEMRGVIETLTNKGKLVNWLDCDEVVAPAAASLPPSSRRRPNAEIVR